MRLDLLLLVSYAATMSVSPPPVITFTTDFGTSDFYVAAMKGAALRMYPQATMMDVTHAVPRHDILFGAIIIAIDIHAGLPAMWTLLDGPPVTVFGIVIGLLNHQSGR